MSDDTPQSNGQSGSQPTRQRSGGSKDPYLGSTFGGRYRIVERIGAGGMGVVYRARQAGLERDVVVKILNHERVDNEISQARFEREAKSLSKLDHQNIVSVYDFGYEGHLSYLVMEYVDGLQLNRTVEPNGGLPMHEFAPIAAQILDAVAEAHRIGMIHRDLKPGNIMLTQRRGNPHFVKVLDFGLAKLVNDDSDLTHQDNLVGSLPYLAPEQIVGSDVDQRVDVYALGVVFYYMLTATKPFDGANAKVLFDQVQTEPPPLQSRLGSDRLVPTALVELVESALAKNPAQRPRDAGEMGRRLLEIAGEPDTSLGISDSRELQTLRVEAIEGPQDAQSADGVSSSEFLGRTHDTQEGTSPRAAAAESSPAPSQTRADRPARMNSQTNSPQDGGSNGASDTARQPEPRRAVAQATPTEDQPSNNSDKSATKASPARWLFAGAGLLGALTLGAALFPGLIGGDNAAVTDIASGAQGQRAGEDEIAGKLDEAEARLEAGKIQVAQARLDMLAPKVDGNSPHRARLEVLRDRLKAARLVESGREHEQNGRFDKAEQAYRDALELRPEQPTASRHLKELARLGTLSLNLPEDVPVKTLRIDGRRRQDVPATLRLEPGAHDIEIETNEGAIWSRRIALERGERVVADVSFEDTESPTPSAGRPAPSERSETDGTVRARPAGDSPTEPSPAPSPDDKPAAEQPTAAESADPDESNRDRGDDDVPALLPSESGDGSSGSANGEDGNSGDGSTAGSEESGGDEVDLLPVN